MKSKLVASTAVLGLILGGIALTQTQGDGLRQSNAEARRVAGMEPAIATQELAEQVATMNPGTSSTDVLDSAQQIASEGGTTVDGALLQMFLESQASIRDGG